MKKPIPADFGMTAEEYHKTVTAIAVQTQAERERRRKVCSRWIGVLMLLAWPLALTAMAYSQDGGFGLLAFFAVMGGIALIAAALPDFYGSRESASIIRMREKIRPYEKAVGQYELRQERHWLSLRGRAFEKKLADLYRKLGYRVTATKASHDGGVDLHLQRDGKKLIVQCKGHQKPIGVAAARDLYGTFAHSKADGAILACPAGFTKGVHAFVKDKPVELISAKELVAKSDTVEPKAKE